MRNLVRQKITHTVLYRRVITTLIVVAAVVALLSLLIWRMWQIRGSLSSLDWPTSVVASEPGDAVTATWLGTTTILFDDGETQLLIDGAFTRVGALESLFLRRVKSDVATINYAMSTFAMTRLAAIIPVHSHHDHAIDVAHVANRSSAVVLGSESTANIARGGNVPVDQYQILADGETRQFGDFTIRLVSSVHAPIGTGGEEIFPGIIERPLTQPARISDYRTGVTWSVFIEHPRGTTLVQGSAGFIEGKLRDSRADVVMLGIAGLAGLGEAYTRQYWEETVITTEAPRVIAVHHDDFSAPFGEVLFMPDLLDNIVRSAAWIDTLVAESAGSVTIELPPFGQPIILY